VRGRGWGREGIFIILSHQILWWFVIKKQLACTSSYHTAEGQQNAGVDLT
jgi:hypothetical protein